MAQMPKATLKPRVSWPVPNLHREPISIITAQIHFTLSKDEFPCSHFVTPVVAIFVAILVLLLGPTSGLSQPASLVSSKVPREGRRWRFLSFQLSNPRRTYSGLKPSDSQTLSKPNIQSPPGAVIHSLASSNSRLFFSRRENKLSR